MSNRKTFGRGAAATLGGQWIKYVIQILGIVVMGRLLGPENFGLVAMSGAIVGVATVIGDFGLSLAAVQARELSQAQRNNLFWINSGIGFTLSLVIIALSPVIAGFYGEPRLQLVTVFLSVTFLLNGLAVQFRVELNRNLRFSALAVVDVVGQGIGLAVGIVAAALGAQYWALVAMQVTVALVNLVVQIRLSGWRPGLPSREGNVRGFLRYGADTFALQVVNYISSNIDSVLVGRYSGSAVLGLYNRAFQLVALPVKQLGAPLTRVTMPALSRMDGIEKVSKASLELHRTLCVVFLSILSYVAATAEPLLRVVLGDEWTGAAPLIRILVIGAAFQAIAYAYYLMFLATARTRVLFWTELPGRIVTVVGIIIVAPFGPAPVAAFSSLGLAVTWFAGTFVGIRLLGAKRWPFFAVSIRLLVFFGGIAAIVGALDVAAVDHLHPLLRLVILSVAWLVLVAAGLLIPPLRRDALTVLGMAKTLRK
ncbi:lipopolysaccharide biosynthesis protein [soil metagenome]